MDWLTTQSTHIIPARTGIQKGCGYGVIGSRARLRIWCWKTCRFESYYPHSKPRLIFQISAFLLRIIGLAHLWRLGKLVGNCFAEMYCLAISSIVLTIKNQTSSLLIISTTLATSLHTSANQFWSTLICGRRSRHHTLEGIVWRNRFARQPRHAKPRLNCQSRLFFCG